MPIVAACPSCGAKLNIPDNLLGKKVRCATCKTIFEARGDASAAPSPLELAPEAPAPPIPDAPQQAPQPPRPFDFIQMELPPSPSITVPEAPPPSAPPRREPVVDELPPAELDEGPLGPDEEYEDYEDQDRRRRRKRRRKRRDVVPHRGGLILGLGIGSAVCGVLGLCCPFMQIVGLPLGGVSLMLGMGDMKQMDNGDMDSDGRGSTQAGFICGIIGLVLGLLGLVCCVLRFSIGFMPMFGAGK